MLQVGQQGKDVIWVPTPDALVDRMLRMARVTPNDFVVDLGAGDGVEYNPDTVGVTRMSDGATGTFVGHRTGAAPPADAGRE